MPRPLDFLLTNDDGIHAPGLVALRSAFESRTRTAVAAPASQRSAVGHSITIHHPILCDSVPLGGRRHGFAVDGTPADCVKLALCELLPAPPRFVLSGINFGANLGVNVFYSGTVAAAMEAAFAGIPSFAISLCTKENPRWKDAAVIARKVVEEFAPFVEGTPVCLNVNIPNIPAAKIRGVRIALQAPVAWEDSFHRRQDPRGRTYFWMDGDQVHRKRKGVAPHEVTDIEAVLAGYVSLTPLRLSLTCEDTFRKLAKPRRGR
ncbi:MAG: 5'/3'-nucleotidase SurE [Planctomycetes bacterium]|nr:5'/3'-nucleotidase SurE [Planctomycetota bacterium]